MGLADRDYYRSTTGMQRPTGLSALRMLSVTTWIIIACVAVFIIDKSMTVRWVETGQPLILDNVQIDRRQVQADPSKGLFLIVEQDGRKFAVPMLIQNGRVMIPNLSGDVRVVVPTAFQAIDKISGAPVGWIEVAAMTPITAALYFSTAKFLHGYQWWRLIGFQFLHANTMHIFFNMLGLYFFGPMVERYLGSKRYLAFYLLCGIFGALMYLLLNLGGYVVSEVIGSSVRVPGLLFNEVTTPLVGASAGVFGVIMAGAYLQPNATVLVFFFLPARLGTVAYVLVAAALISVLTAGANAGGEAGHLGGALAGWYFIRHPRHLHGFFDLLGRVDPTSHHYRHRRRAGTGGGGARQEIDRILQKISSGGIHSLSEDEKRILREASER